MFTFINLILLFISLFIYINYCVSEMNNDNIFTNKICMWLFVFIISFISGFINKLVSSNMSIHDLIVFSVNNAIISVIAYDTYNDMIYHGYFSTYSHEQKSLILVLLMISFITIIKLIQIIITFNF